MTAEDWRVWCAVVKGWLPSDVDRQRRADLIGVYVKHRELREAQR